MSTGSIGRLEAEARGKENHIVASFDVAKNLVRGQSAFRWLHEADPVRCSGWWERNLPRGPQIGSLPRKRRAALRGRTPKWPCSS